MTNLENTSYYLRAFSNLVFTPNVAIFIVLTIYCIIYDCIKYHSYPHSNVPQSLSACCSFDAPHYCYLFISSGCDGFDSFCFQPSSTDCLRLCQVLASVSTLTTTTTATTTTTTMTTTTMLSTSTLKIFWAQIVQNGAPIIKSSPVPADNLPQRDFLIGDLMRLLGSSGGSIMTAGALLNRQRHH